jgi:glycosyltransferase involved in cell wall biosynthesis
MKELTLIIPAKNEPESLPYVLKELEKLNLDFLIIMEESDFVTINAIEKFKSKIIFQENKGYGDALILGLQSVKTKFFLIYNADGSMDPNEITKFYFKMTDSKIDLLFGSRYSKDGSSEDDTITTYIGNKIFTLLGKIFFSLPISDILYTYVMGDTKKTLDLKLKKKDFRVCVELPIKAIKNNLKLADISSKEKARIGGVKKVNAFRDGLLILIEMINLFFKKK